MRVSWQQISNAEKASNEKTERVIKAIPSKLRKCIFDIKQEWQPQVSGLSESQSIYVVNVLRVAIARYMQVHSVIEDTKICLLMASRYPWHGTTITKSNHFDHVWFNFCNQCYLFHERVKNFQNEMNKVRRLSSQSETSVSAELKKLVKLKEFIKLRGQHVHEWPMKHQSYDAFAILEFMNSAFGEYEEIIEDHYLDAKREVKWEISQVLLFMHNRFQNLDGAPEDLFLTYFEIMNDSNIQVFKS